MKTYQTDTNVARRVVRKKLPDEVFTDKQVSDHHVFDTEPAHVRYSVKTVLNQGNFESVHIEVSIQKPCYSEDIDETYKHLTTKVKQLVNEEIKKHQKHLDKNT